MTQIIGEVLPSYYFPAAVVLELLCGHRHVRPKDWPVHAGGEFDCCFCDDGGLERELPRKASREVRE